MIKSSISQLEKSFENTENEIQLTEIQYLDYKKEKMYDGNLNYPVLHKHTAYAYEDEVRLIFHINKPYWEVDWTKEEVEEGKYILTDVSLLIDEIIISPYSAKWFMDLIQDITQKYGLNKIISRSTLSLIN